MRAPAVRIAPMRRVHVPACDAITRGSDPWKTLGERIDFTAHIARNESYVCLVDGTPAGFVVFTRGPVFARGGYLRAIGVAPDFRRRGLGARLLAFAERATVRQAENLFLCVSSFNRRAQAFYRSRGYVRAGALPGLITPTTTEYIYWKRLKRSGRKPGGNSTP